MFGLGLKINVTEKICFNETIGVKTSLTKKTLPLVSG